MSVIHRYGIRGGAKCGAEPDSFGHLKISISGIRVTCPACTEPSQEERRTAGLTALNQAAQSFRGRKGQ